MVRLDDRDKDVMASGCAWLFAIALAILAGGFTLGLAWRLFQLAAG